jgi:hypothetical protein
MIIDQHCQEQLSRAYVHAVTAHSGLIFEPTSVDYGVDGTIRVVREKNGRHFVAGHVLDVQLKATTSWSIRDDSVVYDLEAKTYNDLVDRFNEPRGTPMVLMVLCLPENKAEWLDISHDQLILRHCCYWCRVGGTRTTNTATQRIKIPKSNIVDQDTVADLLQRVRRGEVLQ